MTTVGSNHWRPGCACCTGATLATRRSFLAGTAALGAASGSGSLASFTGASAQGAVAPRGSEFVIRGGYVITMDKAAGDIPVGDVHVRNGAIVAVAPSIGAPGAEIDRRPGHDRDAGIHRDAFALLECAAEEHAPARRRVFSAEGGVRQAPHADRLLPGRAAVHDRRVECRHHHGHQLRSQHPIASACRRRDPRHDGKRIARPLRLQRTRSVSQRQDDRLRRRAPRQAHVLLAAGQPDRSRLRAAALDAAVRRRSRPIRRSSASRSTMACRSSCIRARGPV